MADWKIASDIKKYGALSSIVGTTDSRYEAFYWLEQPVAHFTKDKFVNDMGKWIQYGI